MSNPWTWRQTSMKTSTGSFFRDKPEWSMPKVQLWYKSFVQGKSRRRVDASDWESQSYPSPSLPQGHYTSSPASRTQPGRYSTSRAGSLRVDDSEWRWPKVVRSSVAFRVELCIACSHMIVADRSVLMTLETKPTPEAGRCAIVQAVHHALDSKFHMYYK